MVNSLRSSEEFACSHSEMTNLSESVMDKAHKAMNEVVQTSVEGSILAFSMARVSHKI